MCGVAEAMGVSYNDLVLVLDGERAGSAKLEAKIARVIQQNSSVMEM